MASDNLERNRRLLEAYNARDLDAMLRLFDPGIEFESAFAAVEGGSYVGHEGLRRWHEDLTDAWGEDVRVEPEAFFDLGEHTLVYYVMRARGSGSGAEVAMPAAYVVRWRDGRAVYLRNCDRPEALRYLDVAEEDLTPIPP